MSIQNSASLATLSTLLFTRINGGYFDQEWISQHGMSCKDRVDQDKDIVTARDASWPVRGPETYGWVSANVYSAHLCFRDDPPTSSLANKFRKHNMGMKVDKHYQSQLNTDTMDNSFDSSFHSLLQSGTFTKSGGGKSMFYSIYTEGVSNKYPVPSYVDTELSKNYYNGDYWGLPPPIKADNDGSDLKSPIWRTNGNEYPIMPNPDLLLTGTEDNPIPKGTYKVKGDPIRTGSHTICAAFEYFCKEGTPCNKQAIIPGKWNRPNMEWLINYGAPGPKQKGHWWIHHLYKFWVGQQDNGHLSYVHNALVQRTYKDDYYRKQLVCTVYDTFNKWLQMYVNGHLFGERSMNQYDEHCSGPQCQYGVSNQFGDVMDIYKPDLYVGVSPPGQANSGRYTNILKDANEKGNDFIGRFLFVGVWNNFVMNKKQACIMAGYKKHLCPNVNVWNIPVFKPQQFPKTPAEVDGITHIPVNYLSWDMNNIQNPIIPNEKDKHGRYYKDNDNFNKATGKATGNAGSDIIGAFVFVILILAILATLFTLLFRNPKIFNRD